MQVQDNKRLAPQKCQYCGEMQDIIINGFVDKGFEDNDVAEKLVTVDYGFSFCNCKNYFFTNWDNNNQGIYDEKYQNKYEGVTAEIVLRNNEQYLAEMSRLTSGREFLEIGCSYSYVMDFIKKLGFNTTGINICKSTFDTHKTIIADFENYDVDKKYDAIYASHVFEHFKDPIRAGRKCYNSLNDKGILFVAMPDPFFVDWSKPYSWGHWHLNEHHTLWDMDSFCTEMEKIGFKTVYKNRNVDVRWIQLGEMNLLFQKGEGNG